MFCVMGFLVSACVWWCFVCLGFLFVVLFFVWLVGFRLVSGGSFGWLVICFFVCLGFFLRLTFECLLLLRHSCSSGA